MKPVTKIELGKTYIVKDIKGEPAIDGIIFSRYMKHLCGKEIVFEEYCEGSEDGYYEGFIFRPGMLLDPEPENTTDIFNKGELKMTHKIKVNNVEIELTAEQIKEIKALPDEPEFEYPLFMKGKGSGQIVRFDNLTDRTTVWQGDSIREVGYRSKYPLPHTRSDIWQPVPYDKERGLWHGQPVEVWDNGDTHGRFIKFYDAILKRTFTFDGVKRGNTYDNIKAIPPEECKPWMHEAYKTLEGI